MSAYNRILLRAGKSPFNHFLGNEYLGGFGTNLGNLLFSDATYLTLAKSKTQIHTDHYLTEREKYNRSNSVQKHINWINRDFEVFVFPFSNCFREGWIPVLRRLTERLQKIKIPLIFCSGNVQLESDQTFDDLSSELKKVCRDFLKLFFERSSLVGVRGEITYDYLKYLGFPEDQISVIGCPSFFMPGYRPRLPKTAPAMIEQSKIALHQNYLAPSISKLIAQMLAQSPNATFVGQTHVDLSYAKTFVKNHATHEELQSYAPDELLGLAMKSLQLKSNQTNLVFPLDSRAWVGYLKTQSMSFGSRFHGSVAAILADIPTVFTRWDSRSKELIEYHQLPYIDLSDSVVNDLLTKYPNSPQKILQEIFSTYDPRPYKKRWWKTMRIWLDFWKSNGIATIYDGLFVDKTQIRALNKLPLVPVIYAPYHDLRRIPTVKELKSSPNGIRTRDLRSEKPAS